ncbi:hypothetical protein AKJ16_DCAP22885 [Drosera capensis]
MPPLLTKTSLMSLRFGRLAEVRRSGYSFSRPQADSVLGHSTFKTILSDQRIDSRDVQDIHVDYESKLRELYPKTELLENELSDPYLHVWKATIGGVKKGRLVDRPGEKWIKRSNNSCSVQFVSQETSRELQTLREEFALTKQWEESRDLIIAIQNEDLMVQYENAKLVNEKLGFLPPIPPRCILSHKLNRILHHLV